MQRDPEISQGRRPKNPTEAQFFDEAAEAGWTLSTRGWPDFFLKLGSTYCVVEIKPASSRKFRQEEARVLGALSEAGFPCFCWSPDAGLQRVSVGEGGLQLEVVGVEVKDLLDVIEGESEGKQRAAGSATPAPVEAPDPDAPADPSPSPASPSQSQISAAVQQVGKCWVEAMNPRYKELGDDDKLVIRNALRVATAHELEVCIRTCAASDYHMKRGQYAQRKGGKYNALGQILKPKPQKGMTQRARIDWWLDRAESAGVARFPSADAAIVNQRQVEVRRGHNSSDPEMVAKAKQAKAWLTEHGIETVIGEGGITFRRIGEGE